MNRRPMTTRQWMIAVAVCAVALRFGPRVVEMLDLSRLYSREAKSHQASETLWLGLAANWTAAAAKFRAAASQAEASPDEGMPLLRRVMGKANRVVLEGSGRNYVAASQRAAEIAAYHASLKHKYQRAAWSPWRPVPPDPPAPEEPRRWALPE